MVSKGYSSFRTNGAGLAMSPARVYGYHTRLFSQSAPKLSVVAQRSPCIG